MRGEFDKQVIYTAATRSAFWRIDPIYEAWTTGPPPIFNLEYPDIKLIDPIIERLGPGRIIDDLAVFDLYTPDPEDSVDNVSALALHAFDFGKRFNKAETNSVYNCPLVFDTW